METAKSAESLPTEFLINFFKLFKTFQKIGQELKDSFIEEQLSIKNISKDQILYFDLTNVPSDKVKSDSLARLLSVFPNIQQINFAGCTEIIDANSKLKSELVAALDKLEKIKESNFNFLTNQFM